MVPISISVETNLILLQYVLLCQNLPVKIRKKFSWEVILCSEYVFKHVFARRPLGKFRPKNKS